MSHGHDEHESRLAEADAAPSERPLRDSELDDPARRDIFTFIDETKQQAAHCFAYEASVE